MSLPLDQHNKEIQANYDSWNRKPLIRDIYKGFYTEVLKYIREDIVGEVIEVGSGIGNFKGVYPKAIATDLFPNPWIDRVESAYHLSSKDDSVSNLVIFDVLHHLKYPGLALREFHRALKTKGRAIIFEPYASLLGLIVYGIFHHEPVGFFKKIEWMDTKGEDPDKHYYAAQGNSARIFRKNSFWRREIEKDWNIIVIKKFAALSYVLSGGFSKPALYPRFFLHFMKGIDWLFDFFPLIFATRVLVVLEKKMISKTAIFVPAYCLRHKNQNELTAMSVEALQTATKTAISLRESPVIFVSSSYNTWNIRRS